MLKTAILAALALQVPTLARADCGTSDCTVGSYGQGGSASGGQSQGFHVERPSTLFPGSTYINSGNADSGRIEATDQGTIQGTFRGETLNGHLTGVFGDGSGRL